MLHDLDFQDINAMTWTPAEGDTPNQETIEFLRHLSEIKELSEETIMQMAEYLNENREARHSCLLPHKK